MANFDVVGQAKTHLGTLGQRSSIISFGGNLRYEMTT